MWLSKPLYESLPFYYMFVGLMLLLTSSYVSYWYWVEICVVFGLGGLVAGLVIWLKRRDYRASRSRREFDQAD
jgi:hypothetical protein